MVNSLGFISNSAMVVRVVPPTAELQTPLEIEPVPVLAAKPTKVAKKTTTPVAKKPKKKIVIKVKKPWGSKKA